MSDNKLEFMPVDVSCLPESLALALSKYKDAEKAAQEAKRAFEGGFIALLQKSGDIPDSHGVAFGYRFGGLAIAFKPLDAAPKKSSRPMFTIGANAPKATPAKGGKAWKK